MPRPTKHNPERGDAPTRLLEAAMKAGNIHNDWTPASLARHTQVVLQGAFILAKAASDREVAREGVDHLRRYIEMLFQTTAKVETTL